MTDAPLAASPPEAQESTARLAAQGRRALLLVQALQILFLLYLLEAGTAIDHMQSGTTRAIGIGDLIVLGCIFVVAARTDTPPRRRYTLVLQSALAVTIGVGIALGHTDALPLAIFFLIPLTARLGERSLPIIVAVSLLVLALPEAFPSWHTTFAVGASFDVLVTSVIVMAFVMVFRLAKANIAAQTHIEELARELERARIARDLHDHLGQSLSAIALKAALAARLARTDPETAAVEAEAVATLARVTLGDVRGTVNDLRQVSLATELIVARDLLEAARIHMTNDPHPGVVDPRHQQLFGWVLREAVTNVLRHSSATSVTIELSKDRIAVHDDGIGAELAWGNGLRGLAERIAAAGGQLVVEARDGVTVQAVMAP